MAEPALWVKGQLSGTCVGKPARKVGGSGLARWYKLELVEAVISDWQPVAGPPKPTHGEKPAPFCQAKLRDARLRSRTPGGEDEELSLRELSVWDWKMRDQREASGESRCTLVGTVYAREETGTRRPASLDEEGRIDRWTFLGLLALLAIGSWLWRTCGPFTCGLWGSVVLVSWWSHRARTRRRTPPSTPSKVLQGALALLIICSGAALVLGLRDPAIAASCGPLAAASVLLALTLVIGVSLMTIFWPRPWIWAVWTVVVLLWCGRSGADCTRQWLERGEREVRALMGRGAAPPPPAAPGTGTPGSGAPGPGGSGSSTSGAAASEQGVTGSGPDGPSGPKLPPTGVPLPEMPYPSPTGSSRNALDFGEGLEAASEPRMTVDDALANPKPFLDGSSRVMLSGDLLFDFDEGTLSSRAPPVLQKVAELLEKNPNLHVLLEGHADTIGGDQYNQTLSEKRAEAVKQWLVKHAHANPLQIDVVGYGNAKPVVAASKSPSQQQPNRRVEVRALTP